MSFRVVSAPEQVRLGSMVMQPFVRYVLPAGLARHYAVALTNSGIDYTQSSFNSFLRPYGGADLNGKRIAIFRHAAFGDQLMTTAVVAYLRKLYPRAVIDVYCSPEVLEIWSGLGVRAFPAPMIFEGVRGYDWHLFFDQMLEENREADQSCALDDLFGFAGLRDVPDDAKRPYVVRDVGDTIEVDALHLFISVYSKKYLVYQLGAANRNRTYPYKQGREFILSFLDSFPDWRVVIVGRGKTTELDQMFTAGELADWPIESLVNRLGSFRSLIPIVENAGLVVCPDSSIGHLAAAFPTVPVISLWGLFSPHDRAKYYSNHHPLWVREVCPHAPCHNHDQTLPQNLCAAAANATDGVQEWCNVLRAVAPQMILAKAKEILSK